jgi:hypothetical protein
MVTAFGGWVTVPAMTTPTPPDDVVTIGDDGIADFTEAVKDIRFRVGPDVFTCVTGLPAMTMIEFAETADKVSDGDITDELKRMFTGMFSLVLTDESAALFIARLSDKKNPIGMGAVNRVVPYIMEQFGMRPSVPSGTSSDGSPTPASGQNSTANTPAGASTSDYSASPAF